jgi:Fe-S cluster assembly protein SufD
MSAKPETLPYRKAFDSHRPVDALAESRAEAFARFEELGFPTRRDEAWRFTDLRPLQRSVFLPPQPSAARVPPSPQRGEGWGEGAASDALSRYALAGDTHRLVLINGRLAPGLCKLDALPAGVILGSTAEIAANNSAIARSLLDETDRAGGQPFAALNAAMFADGFVLTVPAGEKLARPIEIIHWGDTPEASFQLRNFVLLGIGSSATVIESFAGSGRYWTNAVTRVELQPSAALRHVKIQDEAVAAIHFAQVRTELARDARFESFVLTLGGRLSRHDSFVNFEDEGAACALYGAYLLKGEQEATNATFVDHAAPRCTTDEVFKGVVDERAHGVFLGRIAVRPDAQKTDAHQLNKNLLLSPRANVDTKPELEILADDVKCSHGATVGDLDEDALFYLAARGIPDSEARRMLVEAFAADAVERLEDPALGAHLLAHIRH